MIYLTLAQVQNAIRANILQEITGGDATMLDAAELEAIGEITGYLNIRYKAADCFDLASIGTHNGIATVRAKLIDMLIFHLHKIAMPDMIPENRVNNYNNAINWLEKVASGYIAPNLPIKTTDPSTSPLRFGNSSEKTNQYY